MEGGRKEGRILRELETRHYTVMPELCTYSYDTLYL